MKFNKFLFWLGLRPLTADIIREEYLRETKERMLSLFEESIVPDLIRHGNFFHNTISGLNTDEVEELENILKRVGLQYKTRSDVLGTYFRINLE